MTIAEELLERWLKNNPRDIDLFIYKDTRDYLDRKDKLVVGSEWVCEVECYSRWYRGGEVVTLRKKFLYEILSWGENEVVFRVVLGSKNEYVMPVHQFLACFSPVEKGE